ncbi:glycosyltransferase family 4 protein [Gaopeijia maritima]|uniref:Glycosyltransferase family 4 protein n=1 Tax=Gaopeijia maritima TaxID=3119007 RepID=A0ABU9E8X9_9BACT
MVNWQDRLNPQGGGAEAHLHEVFGRLAERGHEVDLLCSGFQGAPPRDRLDGIDVFRAGGRHTFPLHARRAFRRLIEPRGPEVIVEDLNKVPLFTPRWSERPVVGLVHHLFGLTAFREASPPVAAATWLLERPIPRVFRGLPLIAVSESTRDDLVRRGLDAERIEVIPNGVDTTVYRPDPGVPRFEQPTLLYLGRLKRYKGVEFGIRAVRRLRDRGLAVRFLIGGRGDDRSRLESIAAAEGVADAVEFLGFVSDERKVELYRRAWVHLLTSPKEGWGITVIEAAACGTPSVASDAPGLRESVRHDDTGLLVPHAEVGALTDTLERVMGDADLRARLGAAATEFAAGFSWDAAASRTERILARAVGSARSAGERG